MPGAQDFFEKTEQFLKLIFFIIHFFKDGVGKKAQKHLKYNPNNILTLFIMSLALI